MNFHERLNELAVRLDWANRQKQRMEDRIEEKAKEWKKHPPGSIEAERAKAQVEILMDELSYWDAQVDSIQVQMEYIRERMAEEVQSLIN